MPRSRRDKVVPLTKTQKKGKNLKQRLINTVQEAAENYSSVYILSVDNMRSSQLQSVRVQWQNSKIIFGKSSVLKLALGKTPDKECKPSFHQLAQYLSGNVGLLFTNSTKDEVEQFFNDFQGQEYARVGFVPSETITLQKGPQPQLLHSMEPMLRHLGMSTILRNGIIEVTADHILCTQGVALTPEQSRLLKIFDYKLAIFKVTPLAYWKDGIIEELAQ